MQAKSLMAALAFVLVGNIGTFAQGPANDSENGLEASAQFSVLNEVSAQPMQDAELSAVRGSHSSAGIAPDIEPPGLNGDSPTRHPHFTVVDNGHGKHPPDIADDQVTDMNLIDRLPSQVTPAP